jgi:hypothetical protein
MSKDYVSRHQAALEQALSRALCQAMSEEAADPIARIGELLLSAKSESSAGDAGAPAALVSAATPTNTCPTEWTLAAWLGSTGGITQAVARALLNPSVNRKAEQSELAFVRELGAMFIGSPTAGQTHVLVLLQQGNVLEAIAASMWRDVEKLAKARTATGRELQAKFTQDGAHLLSYAGLNTFFLGLGGKIGDPNPKVEETMAYEHTMLGDAHEVLYAANYEVRTSAAIEYAFVATPDSPPTGG